MGKTIKLNEKEPQKIPKIGGINYRAKIVAAHKKLKAHINYTRVMKWPKSNLWLKMESEQVSGSFKVRGGGYKVISLNA
jgi:threonine dehydratase